MKHQPEISTLEEILCSLFSEVTHDYNYPENTFSIKKNYSKKGKNAGNLNSTEIDLNEFSYPYDKNNEIAKTTLVLYIAPTTTCHELMVRKERFQKIPLPPSATVVKEPTEKTLYYHVAFSLDDASVYQYIKDNLIFCINNYESSNSFGCCCLYQECSNMRKCIHSNNLYAKGCAYRKNLEKGLVFYGDTIKAEQKNMKGKRIYKGKNLISFPDTFTVIDIETTGLSPEHDEIIEVSALKISNHSISDSFSSLLKPTKYMDGSYVSDFIAELTGISNDMLANAPDTAQTLKDFFSFLGNDILLGHNINFDVNFLYDYSEKLFSKPFTNDFIDTMRISKRLHPDCQHHRLSDVCERYSIEYSNAHRALADCNATIACFQALCNEIISQFGSLDNFVQHCVKTGKASKHPHASDILPSVTDFDTLNPLYGKVFVFTGTLEKMTRKEAMQTVVNHGGITSANITKKTNYLVLGNNDYCTQIKDGKSNTQKKAESLKLQNCDIDIITENVFYDMLEN